MIKDPIVKYYIPTKSYNSQAIKRQWYCVKINISHDGTYDTEWIEANISGRWWKTFSGYDNPNRLDDMVAHIELYFEKEEDAVLYKITWL